MRHARLTLALGLAVLTAACGKKGETPVTTETNQAAPAATMSGDMGNMSMAPDANAAIKAKGHGTVTAIDKTAGTITLALLQRLAAVRGRLSLCADQAAAAKWWLSMPMASVSAEGPMPKALSTRRTSPLMPGCRHQGRACPLRRARMTSNPLIVA